jgi:hypothetical protein
MGLKGLVVTAETEPHHQLLVHLLLGPVVVVRLEATLKERGAQAVEALRLEARVELLTRAVVVALTMELEHLAAQAVQV